MLERLDHVGIAVRSLDAALAIYRDALGLALERVEEVPSQKVRVAFLRAGSAHIELLEPLSEDSPIARFIAKRGEGVHHLSFHVADVRTAAGALPPPLALAAPPAEREGGYRVAFVHPKGTCGVLLEMSDEAE